MTSLHTMAVPSAATSSIVDFMTTALAEYNQSIVKGDEDYYRENPDEERVPPAVITMQDLASVFLDPDRAIGNYELGDFVEELNEAIVAAINTVAPIDPWPDLTRRELKFLIGDRFNSSRCPWQLRSAVHGCELDEPMTFQLKFVAARHRAWLEKDIEKRRAKLVKAKALIAAMEGRAA